MTFTVLFNPQQRIQSISDWLQRNGLPQIKENENAAYCPISLTLTPDELKPHLQSLQNLLMKKVLGQAGIAAYDPSTAPYSPDLNPTYLPNEVYVADVSKIASARFFVGHNIVASNGFGTESQVAIELNRISVILTHKNIRISRMQPHRTIYLQCDNFEQQISDFIKVFKLLKQFSPGIGLKNKTPVLLGFRGNEIVDLEQTVYERFPHLQYKYDGSVPILKLKVENKQILGERDT